MAQDNREANLVNALSGLVDSYYDIHSNGESCPACGGEYIDDVHGLMSTTHDEDCPLAVAVKLLVPSLNQDSGITPNILCDQLNRYRQEFEGVLSIELYDIGLEWEGVIVHLPEHSWVIGIHGQDPAWDSNGYLDWSMYNTGADMDELGNTRHLFLDGYIGMGVADDSKGWSLEQMVAKIAQVLRDKELFVPLPVKHCKLCLSIEAGHRGMAMVESYIEDRRNEGVFLITEPSPAGTPFKEVVANCHTPLHRVDGMVRLNPDLGIDSPYGYHFEVTMYDFDHLT